MVHTPRRLINSVFICRLMNKPIDLNSFVNFSFILFSIPGFSCKNLRENLDRRTPVKIFRNYLLKVGSGYSVSDQFASSLNCVKV